MIFVSEKEQSKVLKKYGLCVQTDFWENHRTRIRSTDHSHDDDVRDGIILQKKYFRNGEVIHKEKDFSPLIKYTYLGGSAASQPCTCPNCGYEGKGEAFSDGCPYCGASYNIEYADRKEGGQYFADKESKNSGLYAVVLLLCLAVCLPVSFYIVRTTGRTFLFFDKLKAVVFGVTPALLIFYLFFVTHAFVISRLAQKKYEKQTKLIRNFEKDLLELEIPLSTFYNNLHSELNYRLYSCSDKNREQDGEGTDPKGSGKDGDVVDADILEYTDFQITEGEDGKPDILLAVRLRRILMTGNRIHARENQFRIRMRENTVKPDELHPGVNIIHCRGCGAPVDVTKKSCEYCGQRINYRQRLYIMSADI
ncbi:MAG: hypothetical protein IJ198_01140 [Lachnospiraceae bacterium]|nr:hypothetical protein [Lachnospiraceae bacterium]